jgi:hypothetical protein
MESPGSGFGPNTPAFGEVISAHSYEATRFAFIPMNFGVMQTEQGGGNTFAYKVPNGGFPDNYTFSPDYTPTNPMIYAPNYGSHASQRYMNMVKGEMTLMKKYWIFTFQGLTSSSALNMWSEADRMYNLYGRVNYPWDSYLHLTYMDFYNSDQIEPWLINESTNIGETFPLMNLQRAPLSLHEHDAGKANMDCYWGSMRIYIYLEGRDPNCFDALLAANMLSAFKFTVG